MDPAGKTLRFKGFPARSDDHACEQAQKFKDGGKWHAMELWAGNDQVGCSELIDPRPLGRRIETLAVQKLQTSP
jgi:hypothetical protein